MQSITLDPNSNEKDNHVLSQNPSTRWSESQFTPFTNLVAALFLSQPFSYRIEMRAVDELFGSDYDFTTP